MIYCHGTSNSKGVCVLFKKGLDYKIKDIARDNEGRVIGIDMENLIVLGM